MTESKAETPLDRKARLQIPAQTMPKQAPEARIHNWDESYLPLDLETARVLLA